MTNVEFGKGSHANWILVPGTFAVLRVVGEDSTLMTRQPNDGGAILMAGSFVATMRLLADTRSPPTGALFAHRRV